MSDRTGRYFQVVSTGGGLYAVVTSDGVVVAEGLTLEDATAMLATLPQRVPGGGCPCQHRGRRSSRWTP
jgi:hypothetical protein